MNKIPDSFCTATPAEGPSLARRLAEFAPGERGAARRDMAAHRSVLPPPSLEMLTAVDFQRVAPAKVGWQR
jgi:hypothetical protein